MQGLHEYKDFVAKVCKASECDERYLKTKIRKREVVRARQILLSYRHLVMGLTQEKSASAFGMDHSSVVHAIKVVRNDYQVDKQYRAIFSEVLSDHEILIK